MSVATNSSWPGLPLEGWQDTCATLHRVSQIVGKIRLALSPHINHWWQATLYVDARGLTTSAIPCEGGIFEIRFDFIDHKLRIEKSDGSARETDLEPRPVAEYYRWILSALDALGVSVRIWRMPVEIPDPIAFDQDRIHASYDPESARRFWRVLAGIAQIFWDFRSGFIGKCSPVHLFWGSFDLAVTRFSGRRAPERPGADRLTREAYSHEVISAGFWPGTPGVCDASFYAYAAPEPADFSSQRVGPSVARYDPNLKEFLLAYDDFRRAPSPEAALHEFLSSTYDAGARLGNWDRAALEATRPG